MIFQTAASPLAQPTRQILIEGTAWTIFGYGASQFARLIGNLILTRLLFPEAFGLMTLINTFMIGLNMFSDMGITVSIIRSPRGDERSYLNTAWTIQVIRGVLLFFAASLCAWPFAQFYHQPELASMIPIAGISVLIDGLASTKLAVLRRHLRISHQIIIEISSQSAGLAATIFLAWLHPSVWSLVYGVIFTASVKTLLSYIAIKGERDRFQWEISAVYDLLHFGKWIFLSTLLYFLVNFGDRLLMGKLLSMESLAVYSVAFFLSQACVHAMIELSVKVLLPVYSRILQEATTEGINQIKRLRLALIGLMIVPLIGLSIGGNWLVQHLYDARYHEAGWMLQILALGGIAAIVNASLSPLMLASGNSFRHMLLMTGKGILLFSCMFLGYYLSGTYGLVSGVAAAQFLEYPLLICFIHRYGVWQPLLDIGAIAIAVVLIHQAIF